MMRAIFVVAAVVLLGAAVATHNNERLIVNLNDSVDVAKLGRFFSNARTPSGAGLIIIGPNEAAPGEAQVDHARIVQHGFGVDPIFSCYFANGDANNMTPVQDRETLCTFQARGCTDPRGCTIEGEGFGLSTVQLRISACEDWRPGSRCTRVLMSTTEEGTSTESTKVIWDDGGHIEYGNFAPTIGAGCGAGARIEGSDNAFRVTMGAHPSSTCTVAFNNSWTLAYSDAAYRPICTANNERGGHVWATPGSADIAIKGRLAAGDDISVICVGRHDWPVARRAG